jgi:hypothetical protein
MHNSAHTEVDIKCNAPVTTVPVIRPLLLFDHTRYTHDASFSILAAARDHVSLNKSPHRAHCPSSGWQIKSSEHKWQ